MSEQNYQFAGRYNLLTLLGKGGFSEVWLAEDVMTQVRVAIKIYAPGQGFDDDGIKIFREEFSIVSDLNHTNLLRPTFYGIFERMPYLILPYCEEGSLEKILVENKRITEDEAWHILRDVARGLSFLHNHRPSIVHQDIKPGNILVGCNGDERIYMITDFGISAKMRKTRGSDQRFSSGGGTIAYMGPERFGTNQTSVTASDIWSLGATLFELMSGDIPFGESGGQAQKAGLSMRTISSQYSSELVQTIRKCLELNPWDRPEASELAEMADNHISHNKFSKKPLIIIIVSTILIILGIVVFNNIRDNRRRKNEMLNNSELACQRIREVDNIIHTGDSLLLNSLDNNFEFEYIKALSEVKSIQEYFGDKLLEDVKEGLRNKEEVVMLKLSFARDSLRNKSNEVQELHNEIFQPLIDSWNERYESINKYIDIN